MLLDRDDPCRLQGGSALVAERTGETHVTAGILVAAASLLGQSVPGLRAGLIIFGGGFLLFEANMVRVYRHLWLS